MANRMVLIYERDMYHRVKIIAAVEIESPLDKRYYMDKGDAQLVVASNIYALNDTSFCKNIPVELHLLPIFKSIIYK